MPAQVCLQAHPAALSLIYGWIQQSRPGGLSEMRVALRVSEAIVAVVDVNAPWPNPWAAASKADREKVERETGRPVDPSTRSSVSLSPEQLDYLQRSVEEYAKQAPVTHGAALVHLIEEVERARKGKS